MTFLLKLIFLGSLAASLQYLLGWWWVIAIAAFFVGGFNSRAAEAFFVGFFGIAFLWLGMAFYRAFPNEFVLAEKVAQLFELPEPILILFATSLFGGIIGGFSALSGSYLNQIFVRNN